MDYQFKRISIENGLLNELWKSWDEGCSKFQEEFSDYSTDSMGTLRSLAEEPQINSRGVCKENDILAICQLNVAHLPKYTGKVLRVRILH